MTDTIVEEEDAVILELIESGIITRNTVTIEDTETIVEEDDQIIVISS